MYVCMNTLHTNWGSYILISLNVQNPQGNPEMSVSHRSDTKPPISPLNTHTKTLFGKARVSFTALSYKTQTYHKTEEAIGYGN